MPRMLSGRDYILVMAAVFVAVALALLAQVFLG